MTLAGPARGTAGVRKGMAMRKRTLPSIARWIGIGLGLIIPASLLYAGGADVYDGFETPLLSRA